MTNKQKTKKRGKAGNADKEIAEAPKKRRSKKSEALDTFDDKQVDRLESLLSVAERNLKSYGTEVVEQRAVPDFRDGLKPVHRCVLWACYCLGLKHTASFKKSARTVGEVLGKYHPHGDKSTYDSMVNLAGVRTEDGKEWISRNISEPLIEGYGNWGDHLDNAAAYRYTEARLSEFSCLYLLDPTYMAVTDYVPNFSGDDVVPLVLPAKLPVMLINGSVSIAFGIAAECPPMAKAGIIELIKMRLEKKEITTKECLQHIVFQPAYGGKCISGKKERAEFFKTGVGSLSFIPEMEVNEAKRTISLTSACPGLTSAGTFQTLTEKLDANEMVSRVSDATGKAGFRYEVISKPGVDFAAFEAMVRKEATKKQGYNIGITERTPSGAKFSRISVINLIKDWTKWRVELEVKVLKYLIAEEMKKLARQKLLLFAVNNRAIILQSLDKEDSAAFLVKKLKITTDEANEILDMRIRQLKALEAKRIQITIKSIEKEIAFLQKDLKKPESRVLKQMREIPV